MPTYKLIEINQAECQMQPNTLRVPWVFDQFAKSIIVSNRANPAKLSNTEAKAGFVSV